ncbi:MAG: hypothetical protein QM786_03400 [Breznakibacter sp.]
MKTILPQMRLLENSDFKKESKLYTEGGIAKMIAKYLPEPDTIYTLVNSSTAIQLPYVFENEEDNLLVAKYGTRHYKSQANGLKVLIFRDSFCSALVPYLSESFGETFFFWTYEMDWSIINKIKPDLVVFQFVERHSEALLGL